MSTHYQYDAVVIGAGPNGLAAAITLARAGRSVIVLEAKDTIGGGSRSKELTLSGFVHDVCSAIHPLGIASPFMRSIPLAKYGLTWLHSPAEVAHPFDDGSAAVLYQSIGETIATLGNDAAAYQQHMAPLVSHWDTIVDAFLGPLRPAAMMRHPFALAGFGLAAIRSAHSLAETWFKGKHARALFAGLSAHSMLPLEQPPSAAFGLMLGLSGHVGGWPFPRGGSQHIVNALARYLRSLGGEIVTNIDVTSLEMLPSTGMYLFDVTPRQLIRIAGNHLPTEYQHQLQRYRYGPGAFKLDYALDGPIPWKAQECTQAGTVHLGNTFSEIAESEWAVT
ncbi:MAG TPA: NAD(P)/FAD-dependent oxidoreductase, partial [Ktedonobacteraceae bacterium]|nr:NAD(P)/FAD-dependent oxidoreductase [Ktedonobacteraceae bacterium]